MRSLGPSPLELCSLLLYAGRWQPAEAKRMKMSGFGAGKKSGAPAPAPAAARRLQSTDCEALIAEVDALCLADVCSSDCAIKLYEASSNGMTAVASGGCQSHTVACKITSNPPVACVFSGPILTECL
jgi:hypothetical protein